MPPLAALLRPQTLDDYIGQTHLVGVDKPLRQVYLQKKLFSMIFWGPPGVGKTSLAKILAQQSGADFVSLSAVSAKKEDIKALVNKQTNTNTVLFLDEIHRFTKSQQDFLLPYVESGELTLIGATTENPSFEIIAPLLSRCRVFILKEISGDEMGQIIDKALAYLSQTQEVTMDEIAREWLINMSNGDARAALTMIENTYELYSELTLESLKETLQTSTLRYDKKGEEHYNTISAFIKSMRASQCDAALYYLARMITAGEDPLFIARRMIVFASEDIGLAVPTALVVANAVFDACHKIGLPECQENLAHGVAYLSNCPKDRRSYDAYFAALADVKKFGNLPIPMAVRNAPTKLMREVGCGKDYSMYSKLSFLPDDLKNQKYLDA